MLTVNDGGFYDLYLRYVKSCAAEKEKAMCWSVFLKLKPWEIKSNEKIESCVCVYHREAALFVTAMNMARHLSHKALAEGEHEERLDARCQEVVVNKNSRCYYAANCACECHVCNKSVKYLSDFTDTILCNGPEVDKIAPFHNYYKLACVKGLCGECGWSTFQGQCQADEKAQDQGKMVQVKLLREVNVDFGGKSKKCKEETLVVIPMKEFMEEAETCLFKFGEHDFVAKWQQHQFKSQLKSLLPGHILIVEDFIENFHMFSKVELQQDYYNKKVKSNFK